MGILDHTSGEIRIHPIESIYHMKCVIEHQSEKDTALLESSHDGQSTWQRRKDLLSAFGSKKVQREQARNESNVVDEVSVKGGAAMKKLLEKNASNIQQIEGDKKDATFLAMQSTRESYMPPFDLSATTIEEAYPIEKLIPAGDTSELEEQFKSLKTELQEGTLGQGTSEEGQQPPKELWPNYITSLLGRLPKKTDISDKKEYIRLKNKIIRILYLRNLLLLHSRPTMLKGHDIVKTLSTSLNIPIGLVNGMLRSFATKEGKNTYMRDQLQQDKLKMHIFVLALSLNSYNMRIGRLCEVMNIPSEKAQAYFKELGCVVTAPPSKEKSEGHNAALKAPLVFPKLKKLKKK